MNVMVTSAGRRTGLLAGFRRAVASSGGAVIAADTDPLAPALLLADVGEIVPPVGHPKYESTLEKLCALHSVQLVIPTIDTELRIFAALRDRFERNGVTLAVSDPRLIHLTSDKHRTVQAFAPLGIRMPRSWLPHEVDGVQLPEWLFVKPRAGSASAHTHPISRQKLASILDQVPDPIIQELIEAPEITVDALLGLDGAVLHYTPRLRLKTVGGESVEGVTLPDEPIRPWLTKVLEAVGQFGGRGPITVQGFLTEGEPTLSEINPRFGGGFPLTMAAGGDYPGWLVAMAKGEKVSPRLGSYRDGVFMTRYLQEEFIDGNWMVP